MSPQEQAKAYAMAGVSKLHGESEQLYTALCGTVANHWLAGYAARGESHRQTPRKRLFRSL